MSPSDGDAWWEATTTAVRTITGPDWHCSQCGELSGPQFTQCWRCGNYREA